MILINSLNNYCLAQTKQNSIIKLFCLQSVKEEMFKAKIEYIEEKSESVRLRAQAGGVLIVNQS